MDAKMLPFVIEERGGIMVLDWSAKGGEGCRPATEPEIHLWHALQAQPAEGGVGGEVAVNGDPWSVTIIEGGWTGTYEEWKRRHRITTPPPSAVPAGWKLVPVEPTAKMKEWGDEIIAIDGARTLAESVYDAMLAAAPAPKEDA